MWTPNPFGLCLSVLLPIPRLPFQGSRADGPKVEETREHFLKFTASKCAAYVRKLLTCVELVTGYILVDRDKVVLELAG